MSLKILIVGCGYVGQALRRKLQNLGAEVHCIRRTPSEDSGYIVQDVSQPFQLQYDYDTIYYMASADAFDEISYQKSYHYGVQNLLVACQQRKVQSKIILVSSTSVFDQSDGVWVDENSPASQHHFAAKALLQGEQILQMSGLPHNIVRFSGIYGPDRTTLIDRVKRFDTSFWKGGPWYTNRIYRDDCVRILCHFLVYRELHGVFIASDCMPTDHNTLLEWMVASLGLAKEHFLETDHTASLLRGNKRCSSNKLIESGYQFIYPTFRQGYAALLERGLQ